jgi:hypothetical protein
VVEVAVHPLLEQIITVEEAVVVHIINVGLLALLENQ